MALVSACEDHRMIDGTELVKAREGLFLNQAAFAARCGWSAQYQSILEQPGAHSRPIEKVNIILKALGKR